MDVDHRTTTLIYDHSLFLRSSLSVVPSHRTARVALKLAQSEKMRNEHAENCGRATSKRTKLRLKNQPHRGCPLNAAEDALDKIDICQSGNAISDDDTGILVDN